MAGAHQRGEGHGRRRGVCGAWKELHVRLPLDVHEQIGAVASEVSVLELAMTRVLYCLVEIVLTRENTST